jgi:hypothetical protein
MWEAAGLAIGIWLTDSGMNLDRPIRSLTSENLQGMAWAAVGAYVDHRASRGQEIATNTADLGQPELFA